MAPLIALAPGTIPRWGAVGAAHTLPVGDTFERILRHISLRSERGEPAVMTMA
ncbi:hypothetical protein [Nonomuraea sp. NPDC049784]|uniref:hypothetical protein n=1 Tax=Nonomuraea sp. NPDC049784 TaxID=3154361 RepID=UPI0033CD8FA7